MPSGRRLLAALALWLLASAVVGGATFTVFRELAPTAIVVAQVYALLIATLVLVFRSSRHETLALGRCSASDFSLAAAVCVAVYMVGGSIQAVLAPESWSAALAILRGMGSDDGRLATAGPFMGAVIVVRACVLAALGEELLFRGVLYAWLRRRLRPSVVIPITAAGWALIHGFPPIVPLAFVMGLGFGWVRERTGSTMPTIAVHAIHNAVLIAISYALTGWTARLPKWGAS
jgi:hypothetical protein